MADDKNKGVGNSNKEKKKKSCLARIFSFITKIILFVFIVILSICSYAIFKPNSYNKYIGNHIKHIRGINYINKLTTLRKEYLDTEAILNGEKLNEKAKEKLKEELKAEVSKEIEKKIKKQEKDLKATKSSIVKDTKNKVSEEVKKVEEAKKTEETKAIEEVKSQETKLEETKVEETNTLDKTDNKKEELVAKENKNEQVKKEQTKEEKVKKETDINSDILSIDIKEEIPSYLGKKYPKEIQKLIDEAYQSGRDAGYNVGRKIGYRVGKDAGYKEGHKAALKEQEDLRLSLYSDMDADTYILPFSNTVYLTENDLYGMNKEMLELAVDEIYARHGKVFEQRKVQEYFDSKDWYLGYIKNTQFNEVKMLSEVEKANIKLMQDKIKTMNNQ